MVKGNAKQSRTQATLEAALSLCFKHDWFIFPANLEGVERKSHKSAEFSDGRKWGMTKDPDEIARDFTHWSEAGIGIPTGSCNGIWVLDVDTVEGHGVDGIDALKKLEAAYGALPPTLMAESPSGSIHYYWLWPTDGTVISNSTSKIDAGLDVRGEGGMVIAPPTRRKDGVYCWLNNNPIAPAPGWLITLAERKHVGEPSGEPQAEPELVAEALRLIPCVGLDYQNWNRIGMACWRATGGSEEGFAAFDGWSQQDSAKYNVKIDTRKHWEAYSRSPTPDLFPGFGTLNHEAKKVDPHWLRNYDIWVQAHLDDAAYNARHGLFPLELAFLNSKRPQQQEDSKGEQQQAEGNSDEPFLFISRADFIKGFVAPNYLVDGVMQRGFIYALTAQTGHGKTALALLLARAVSCADTEFKFGPYRVEKGKVLYLSGENTDDVQARVIGADALRNDDPNLDRISFIPRVFDIGRAYNKLVADAERVNGVDLVIVDTSAAYYTGENENDNVEIGRHARMLRALTQLPGKPCVLVLCHPTKAADRANLVPRGGGAFLNEIDGNLTASLYDENLVDLHHTKMRGPGFEPITFRIEKFTTPKLVDSQGRMMTTVRAVPLTDAEAAAQSRDTRQDQDKLLAALSANPNSSYPQLISACGWSNTAKSKVHRLFKQLEEAKLVKRERDIWVLTPAGAKSLKRKRPFAPQPGQLCAAGTLCARSGQPDGVYHISDARNPAAGKVPLHEACAEAHFAEVL
jgi:hypothetical protein